MIKTNKKCCVCGNEYYYCSGCPGKSPAYMSAFCSVNCKKIYQAVAGFNFGDLTREQARDMLKECDLHDRDHFSKATQAAIIRILGESKTPSKETETETKVVEPAKEENKKEPVVNVQKKKEETEKLTEKLMKAVVLDKKIQIRLNEGLWKFTAIPFWRFELMKHYCYSNMLDTYYCFDGCLKLMNLKQVLFYVANGVPIKDVYASTNYQTQKKQLTFVVDKFESMVVYNKWQKLRNKDIQITQFRAEPEDSFVRILNVSQVIFYLEHKIRLHRIMAVKDYKTNEPVLAFYFARDEIKGLEKEWLNHRNKSSN